MRLFTAIAMVLTLGLGSVAHAAGGTTTLVAGPLEPDGPRTDIRLRCNVVNVSTKDVAVTILHVDQFGSVRGATGTTLAPGTGATKDSNDDSLDGFGMCHFVVQGKASAVRANATIFEIGRGTIAAVPAR